MGMNYTQIEVPLDMVRDEILAYMRENRHRLVLSAPSPVIGTDRLWCQTTEKTGVLVHELVDQVYERLIASGKASRTAVPVNNSALMHANNAYFPLQTKTIILEEILELVHAGVLIQTKFKPQSSGANFNFEFDLGAGSVILTQRGIRLIAEEPAIPHFAEQYLDRLRQTAEPDDELKGYLSEGLACLRHHLGRAAAVLLRLAAEHTLNSLIHSTIAAIGNVQERSNLQRNINKARMNIEERAEVVFRKLESEQGLLPHKGEVNNRLRPAFHSIRDLGGRAAHLSSPIQLEEVRDHYTLYASSVYTVTARIIQHQGT